MCNKCGHHQSAFPSIHLRDGSWAGSGVADHLDALRWTDNIADHEVEAVRVIRYVLHLLQALFGLLNGVLRLLISVVVLFLERSHVGAQLDCVFGQLVLEQFIEVDVGDIGTLYLHLNIVLRDLHQALLLLIRLPRLGRLLWLQGLFLGLVGGLRGTLLALLRLASIDFSHLFPLEEGIRGDGHANISFDLRRLLERGLYRLNHARRLVDLLALLHALFVVLRLLLNFEVRLVDTLRQIVHHLDNGLALALAQRVLPKQVQIGVFLGLEQVLLEDTIELVTEHV